MHALSSGRSKPYPPIIRDKHKAMTRFVSIGDADESAMKRSARSALFDPMQPRDFSTKRLSERTSVKGVRFRKPRLSPSYAYREHKRQPYRTSSTSDSSVAISTKDRSGELMYSPSRNRTKDPAGKPALHTWHTGLPVRTRSFA